MTIQEMFNLLLIQEQKKKALEHTFYFFDYIEWDDEDTQNFNTLKEDLEKLEIKKEKYQPYFTPMHCKHCVYTQCEKKNKPFGQDWCSLYEVKIKEK